MKKNIQIFCLLITGLAWCQTEGIQIDYVLNEKLNASSLNTTIPATLYINDDASLYEENWGNEEKISEGNNIIISSGNTYVYSKKDTVYYSDFIFLKDYFIQSTIPHFDWTLTDQTKVILGHVCQEAKVKFRGRNYTAYFTTDFDVIGGPDKFNGLPGLILEVATHDNTLKVIKAQNILFLKKMDKLVNPYQSKKLTSLKKFETIYKKTYKRLKNHPDYAMDGAAFMDRFEIINVENN